MSSPQPEVWLRGPVPGIHPLLQPAAHALLQAREEVERLVAELPEERLWGRPGGVASAGFHLQHLAGVLDRLFTYARGEQLSERQRRELALETGTGAAPPGAAELLARFHRQVDAALEQLRTTGEAELSQPREVGVPAYPPRSSASSSTPRSTRNATSASSWSPFASSGARRRRDRPGGRWGPQLSLAAP